MKHRNMTVITRWLQSIICTGTGFLGSMEWGVKPLVLSVALICFSLTALAGEWINVLAPGTSRNQIVSGSEFRTIPELKANLVADTGRTQTVRVTYDLYSVLKSAAVREGKSYDTFHVPDCGHRFGPGKPDIPAKSIFIKLPETGRYSVENIPGKTTCLENIDFFPVQPLPRESLDFAPLAFERDESLYARDSFFPKNNIVSTRELRIREHRLLEIVVSPIQYNPVAKEVRIAPSLDIRIRFEKGGQAYGTGPGLAGYTPLFSGGHFHIQGPAAPFPAATRHLEKYMILANDQFINNPDLAGFVLWKKQKGYDVRVVSTSYINNTMGGSDPFANALGFMRGLSGREYPDYLLIIGDHRPEQGVRTKVIKTHAGGYSDHLLSCRDDVDYLPDLYRGRLPASNNEELSVMLKKILAMDRNPPGQGPYDRALVTGMIQDRYDVTGKSGRDGRADRLFFETGDTLACYFENHPGIKYQCTSLFENPNQMDSGGFWNKDGIVWAGNRIGTRPMKRFVSPSRSVSILMDRINTGVALIQYRAHGSPLGWGHPEFSSAHLGRLENQNRLPVVFSVTCLTGAYHVKDNFSKTWLTHPRGGACAVIASVDASFSWTNDMFVHGMYAAFLKDYIHAQNQSRNPDWPKPLSIPTLFSPGATHRLGPVMNAGLLYLYEFYNRERTKTTFELFHLFGDPESALRLHRPTRFAGLTHPGSIPKGGSSTIEINGVEKGTRVCLFSDNAKMNIHQVKKAENGTMVFDVVPGDTGRIFVTATRHDKIPYQGIIRVSGEKARAFSQKKKGFVRNLDPGGPKEVPAGDDSEYKSIF